MSATIRRARILSLLAVLAWVACLLSAASAPGAVKHELEGSFTGADTPEASLGFGIAAAAGAGDGSVYIGGLKIASRATSVYKFDADGHYAGTHITGASTPQGSFALLSFATGSSGTIAVDASAGPNSGDLYVADVEHRVVDRFSDSGTFECQLTMRPPASRSASEAAAECNGAAGSETAYASVEPTGLAVQPGTGDLYVADAANKVIDVFGPGGGYLSKIGDPTTGPIGSIALDGSGNLYVTHRGAQVVKFHDGSLVGTLDESAPQAVAVDRHTGHVYVFGVSEGKGRIAEYDTTGQELDTFGSAQGVTSSANMLAVNSAGRVYLGKGGNYFETTVFIYSPDIVVPTVVTGGTTEVGERAAKLDGEVDPEQSAGGTPVESCAFQYIDDVAYQQAVEAGTDPYASATSVECSPPAPYGAATKVSAAPEDLNPSTTYRYRLVAANAEAQGHGEERTFTTFGSPSISGERAIARTSRATVEAQIDPFGYQTSCRVQYVDDASFQAHGYEGAESAPCDQTLSGDFQWRGVSASLDGLTIGTEYHFRFVADNAAAGKGGITMGSDHVFSTFGIKAFSVELLGEDGKPYVEPAAGAHPFKMRVAFEMTTTNALTDRQPESVAGNLRTVRLGLPPGLVGNPTAVPTCRPYGLESYQCPPASQVGTAVVESSRGTTPERGDVFNLDPPVGSAAQLGIQISNVLKVRIDAGVRTGSDYGIDTNSISVTTADSVKQVEITLWGVPADEAHRSDRGCVGNPNEQCPSGMPLIPFLTNPTACSGPLSATLAVDAWQEPGNFVSALAPIPAMTGCDRLPFVPTISVQPQSHASESPTGLHVDLHVPQNQNPEGLAEAHLKDTVVRLPAGVAVNPSGANGLDTCRPAQIGYKAGTAAPAEFTPDPARCPEASKIGTVEVDTPLLDHPLPGAVYVATPHDNPFDSLLAIYIAVNDPKSGVVVKLAGKVTPDPRTGQLTATFDENPQLPFEDFKLDFFGGPGASLMTPQTCGTFTTTTDMTPWSENGDKHPSDSFSIAAGAGGGPCASTLATLPDRQSLSTGTISPAAGAETPFVLNLSRADGTQRLSRIDTVLPPGLVGKLAGHPYCPEAALAAAAVRTGSAEIASPSCPAASRVGSVRVGAGAGPTPYFVSGSVYLAGPYKGAPLSLAVVTPAVAGPFDLGTVVVRVALYVDPVTAQITAKSDPLPQILEGIPLDLRAVRLQTDITRNPTNCEPMAVNATVFSVPGAASTLSNRFQVGGCRGLGFHPRLKLRLKGATGRTGHPALRAVVTARHGEANIGRAQVNLPHGEFLDQGNIDKACTKPVLLAGNCPKRSVYGHAKAWTPLLAKPLQGPVYLVGGYGYKLPALVAELNGQIRILLVGKVDSGKNKGIRSTFETVPDAPVSRFELRMKGGKKYGLLENSENLCRAKKSRRRAIARFTGHNGKVEHFKPVVANQCGKHKRHKKRNTSHARAVRQTAAAHRRQGRAR